jgi:signal transduction histidine kinase
LKINQIELRYPKTDAKFIGSKSELAQVLLNIFSNSKEAFIQKEIKNRLIDLSITHNEKYLIIKILDNAGGVEPEYLSHLGEAYFSTKKSQNGTGIGMYMSKMIIEKMGGKLLFENKKKGLQVTIELPNIKE